MFKPLGIKCLIWWPQICEETCNTSLSFYSFSVSLLTASFFFKDAITCINCIHYNFLCLVLLIIVLACFDPVSVGVKCQIIPDLSRHPQLIPHLFNRSVHQWDGTAESKVHTFTSAFQVFGDYYHFRHRTVVKRSLSDHRGTQVRLDKDPKVRLPVWIRADSVRWVIVTQSGHEEHDTHV